MMKNKHILEKLNLLIPNPKCSLNYEKDYELLIAVMLSAQSTDARVNVVTKELFKYDIYELVNMNVLEIEQIIRPVGTFHRKALYLKEILSYLVENYNGKVPNDRKILENLPGVGHKTCNVVLAELFDVPTIPVDTHVTRVSKRLGLASENDNVLIIEKKLMKSFDKKFWNRLHLQLVLFGRHHCTARKPLCESCPFRGKECILTQNKDRI